MSMDIINRQIMTDAEFWGVLAETIEGAETLPQWSGSGNPCVGLCDCVYLASVSGLVTFEQKRRLINQIRDHMTRRLKIREAGRLAFPAGDWRSRVGMCRELMLTSGG